MSFEPPIVRRVSQQFLDMSRERVGMTGIFPRPDGLENLIFLRTTFYILLVDRKEIGSSESDSYRLDMFVLFNGRVLFYAEIPSERDRIVVGESHITQILSLTGGTAPFAGIDIIQVTATSYIPNALVVPGAL